jgi:serine/threonine protein kinase
MIEESINKVSSEIALWNWDDYTFQKVIQKAPCNHGEVLLVHGKAGDKIAAKRMPTSWVREGYKSFKQTYQTAENPWYDMAILRLLNKMSFAYVCKFQGVYRDFHDTYVCSEFATQGDLFVWCTETNLQCSPMREKVVQPLMAQLLTAVMVLHDMNIAHRDISIENILLTDNPDGSTRVLLVDFGMAVASRECSRNAFGKKHYRAPELHKHQAAYDVFLVDDFALGVVLFCWIVSDHPWTNTTNDCPLFRYFQERGLRAFLRRRKFRSGKSYLSDHISSEVVDVLEGLLQSNPAKRSCVGEDVYREEPMKHASVWDKAWLYRLAPKASEASGYNKGLEQPLSGISQQCVDREEGELRVIV